MILPLGRRPHNWLRKAGGLAVVIAALALPKLGSAASQSFNVLNNQAQPGMLMSASANAGVVEPASNQNAASLVGVIGTGETALDQQPGQVSVQTDGVVSTLVSTIGGNISVGDRIAPSSLVGIGAKVTGNGWIVGIAQASLDSKTQGALRTMASDSSGAKHTVYVARIPVVVKVTYYTAASSSSSAVPSSIQKLADRIAGKHVKTLAIVLSFLLLVVGVVLAAQIVNSAVRGGMAAVARQPLSKAVILPKIIQAFVVAFGLTVVVLAGAYMILHIF